MIFKKKPKEPGIFDDLPIFEGDSTSAKPVEKKHGRRAMLVPATAASSEISSDSLLANTGKQKELWLELIFASDQREEKKASIAFWLQDNYRVQKWWANSIALMYLEWREAPKTNSGGETVLRLAFNLPTFVSSTYNILIGENVYGADFKRFLKQVQSERIVLTFTDETRATLTFRSDGNSTEVLMEHEFIDNPVLRKSRTNYWNELFAQVSKQVSQ